MSLFTPTALQKVQAIEHIYYEAWRLDVAYREWVKAIQLPKYHPARLEKLNNSTELVLLHTRALRDFFLKAPSKDDDILCGHYDFKKPTDPLDKFTRDRINKEVAHLSYGRCGLSELDKNWDFRIIVPNILFQCRDFFRHSDAEYIAKFPSPELRQEIQKWVAQG